MNEAKSKKLAAKKLGAQVDNAADNTADEPIVRDVAALLECSEAQARLSVDAVTRAIESRTLGRGRKSALRGFGAFFCDAAGRLLFKPA